jgi:uncharacterized protein (DUF433 family)
MPEVLISYDRSTRVARELLSLLEAVVLAEVPERRVRKDIEHGRFPSGRILRFDDRRLCFHWAEVFIMAAVYGNLHLSAMMRKRVFDVVSGEHAGFSHWRSPNWKCKPIHIDNYVILDLKGVCKTVRPRVDLYADGLTRIEEKEGVLGGDAVFRDTRLSVAHIGKMYDKGESAESILSDYPYLRESDIKFARLYYRAHPITGRPRASVEANSGDIPIIG